MNDWKIESPCESYHGEIILIEFKTGHQFVSSILIEREISYGTETICVNYVDEDGEAAPWSADEIARWKLL